MKMKVVSRMTNATVEPSRGTEGPAKSPMSKKEAKAQAAAAEAYAKSQRSWPARHKFLTGLGVLVVGGGIITATQSGGSDTSGALGGGTGASPQVSAKQMPGLNTAVRDGKFEFTVKSVTYGVTSVGPVGIAEKAQGQFVLVKVHVANIGSEAQMLDGTNQFALDAQGHKYSASTAAEIVLADAQTFLKDINPGNAVDGTIVFDVPKSVKINRLELHDSAFSDGVSVKVG